MCCLAITMQAQQKEHVVQRGEDFTTIARKYAISEQELKDANPTCKVCYAGLKLIIPKHGVPVERKEVTPKPIDIELLSSDDDILTKSSAATYQVGHSLWREHNYMGAFVYLHAALRDGDKRAYYPLGNCYAQDSVQCYNINNAVNYYRLAISETKDKSEEGYWMACGALASLYMEGRGVDKDLNQAKKLCAEYQRYADTDNKKDADKLMNSIKAEERAIAERVAAEKRAAQQLAAAERRKAQQQAAAERRKAQQQAAAQKRAAQQQTMASKQQQAIASTAVSSNVPSASHSTSETSRNLEPFTVKVGMGEMTYYPQADGSMKSYTKMPCIYCHGTLRCAACQYTSMVQSGLSSVLICPMCGGTGMCLKCQGKGYTESWGYVDSNLQGYIADNQGHITTSADVQAAKSMKRSSSSSSSSSSTRSSSSSSSSTCSTCHGSGVHPTPNSGGGLSSFIKYYNSEGTKCPYCANNYTAHFHDFCHSCSVPTTR